MSVDIGNTGGAAVMTESVGGARRISIDHVPGFDASFKTSEDPKDATLRRWKEGVLFAVALIGVFVLLGGCAWIAFGMNMDDKGSMHMLATPTPDDRKWAMSILTAGLGGLIGYLVKK